MLTREQRDRYLANGGARCPYCDSTNVIGKEVETEGYGLYQEVYCYDCDSDWVDVYRLVDVEDA